MGIRDRLTDDLLLLVKLFENSENSTQSQELISRISVQIFCCWIEDEFDQILNNHFQDCNFFKEKVKKLNGFDPSKVKEVFYCGWGIEKINKIFDEIKNNHSDFFEKDGQLDIFYKKRNKISHTNTKENIICDSPRVLLSQYLQNFKGVFDLLEGLIEVKK